MRTCYQPTLLFVMCLGILTIFGSPTFTTNSLAEDKTEQELVSGEDKSTTNAAAAREKIQALGLRDDTVEYQEQPLRWLRERRSQFLPQLIEGLDNEKTRIALGCLEVLDGMTESKDFLQVLLRIAGDHKHPIHKEATLSLCPFAENEPARKILEKALIDTITFDDPQQRAAIAVALDRKTEAVTLLAPLLESQKEEYKIIELIRWLGEIGHPSALESLIKFSSDSRWFLAKESYLALAMINPERYGLTAEQRQFLTESSTRFKENWPDQIKRWKKLAGLNRKEIRSLVMQMIHSDRPEPALIVLQIWQDKEALPEIEEIMKAGDVKGWQLRMFIAAYLNIEGTDASIANVIAMVKNRHPSQGGMAGPNFLVFFHGENEVVLAVTQSIMPDEHKLLVLSRFRDEFGSLAVAGALPGGGAETAEIVRVLMAKETDIPALGEYVKIAARDPEKSFDKEVYAALERLAGKESLSPDETTGASLIFDGCATYELPGSGKLADKFLSPATALPVRMAAARVSAILGGSRREALQILCERLSNSNPEVRKSSSGYLASIKCQNDTERAEREDIILSHLGQPTEDYALRVLTTCAGKRAAEMLLPILDENSVPRAVYAAWVLTRHPDQTVRQKALRRLAVYALFNHQIYQAGAGIDFAIAPDLTFHQVTENLNRRGMEQKPDPAHIPDELLVPFTLDEGEQEFAIRAYRYCRLNILFHEFPPWYLRPVSGIPWDTSHLFLFLIIAREDPQLGILYVKGEKVAHFENRKAAAALISGITKEKASYTGLAGEEIDSEQVPLQPYQNQNTLIARHILDQIQTTEIPKSPVDTVQYNKRAALERMIHNLTEELGDELKEELVAESNHRNITAELKQTGFSIWQTIRE